MFMGVSALRSWCLTGPPHPERKVPTWASSLSAWSAAPHEILNLMGYLPTGPQNYSNKSIASSLGTGPGRFTLLLLQSLLRTASAGSLCSQVPRGHGPAGLGGPLPRAVVCTIDKLLPPLLSSVGRHACNHSPDLGGQTASSLMKWIGGDWKSAE